MLHRMANLVSQAETSPWLVTLQLEVSSLTKHNFNDTLNLIVPSFALYSLR